MRGCGKLKYNIDKDSKSFYKIYKLSKYNYFTAVAKKQHQGKIMESLGERRGELQEIQSDNRGRVRMNFRISRTGQQECACAFLVIADVKALTFPTRRQYL